MTPANNPPPGEPDPISTGIPTEPTEATEPAPEGDGAGLGFDLSLLEQMINTNRKDRGTSLSGRPAAATAPAPAARASEPVADPTSEALGELADDMLDLLKRVKGIEAVQADLVARLERIETATRDGTKQVARETDNLRRDLLGEHSALAARAVAEAVFPVLDKLRPMRAAVNPRRDTALANQLDAVLEILNSMLRAFGFTVYEPAVGTPFDPTKMRCAGEKKGPPGVVLGVDQPGYLAKDSVLRPAGVFIAPHAPPR